jgi:acetylglutamate kinase
VENIAILKQALPYIKLYRGKTFVIKLGGELLQTPGFLDGLAHDVALLYQLNIRLVIIHGGGPQLSEMAAKMGIESRKVGGRRITDDRMIEVANMVFSGASTDILGALRSHGTPGVGLSGVDGDLVLAERRPPVKVFDDEAGKEIEVDFQNVGDIKSVRPQVLNVLLDNRFVPVVAPLGADENGKVLNINADTIAAEIAGAMPAEKLFLLTNVAGVLRDIDDPKSRISYLTDVGTEELIANRGVKGGMVPKLQAALRAIRGGVRRAHVINGLTPNSLLYEVFTHTGLGTMIIDHVDEESYRAICASEGE